VLAAGASSRLGRPKQTLDLAGKPVLQHVVDAAAASMVDRIVVVVGHAAADVLAVLRLPPNAEVAINREHQQGQSTSLRAGLRSASRSARAVVVLLGDQPGIRSEAVDAVVAAWRAGGGPVVQASYQGQPAHPMLFDRSTWPELEQARGDEGARALLASNPAWCQTVEMGDLPPEDIDTQEDYARAREAFRGGD
jgi:molybdenum cofactor cytidylyltransferase